ncbi:hypothetical protein HK101_009215 [Irineochytrium annulatum]|nr:hypothetical protein HK101_009215 [Irineochytrium annulatum]
MLIPLLVAGAALAVPIRAAAPDPCNKIQYAAPMLGSDVMSCFNHFPATQTLASSIVNNLLAYLQIYPSINLATTLSGMSIVTALEAIANDATLTTEYAVQSAIAKAFNHLNDAHTVYQNAQCFSVIQFMQPWVMGARYTPGDRVPVVYLKDSIAASTIFSPGHSVLKNVGAVATAFNAKWKKLLGVDPTSYKGYSVIAVDGLDTITAMQRYGVDYIGTGHSDESRFMYSLASTQYVAGSLQVVDGAYYSTSTFLADQQPVRNYTLTSPDGSTNVTISVPWLALLTDPYLDGQTVTSNDYYNAYCVSADAAASSAGAKGSQEHQRHHNKKHSGGHRRPDASGRRRPDSGSHSTHHNGKHSNRNMGSGGVVGSRHDANNVLDYLYHKGEAQGSPAARNWHGYRSPGIQIVPVSSSVAAKGAAVVKYLPSTSASTSTTVAATGVTTHSKPGYAGAPPVTKVVTGARFGTPPASKDKKTGTVVTSVSSAAVKVVHEVKSGTSTSVTKSVIATSSAVASSARKHQYGSLKDGSTPGTATSTQKHNSTPTHGGASVAAAPTHQHDKHKHDHPQHQHDHQHSYDQHRHSGHGSYDSKHGHPDSPSASPSSVLQKPKDEKHGHDHATTAAPASTQKPQHDANAHAPANPTATAATSFAVYKAPEHHNQQSTSTQNVLYTVAAAYGAVPPVYAFENKTTKSPNRLHGRSLVRPEGVPIFPGLAGMPSPRPKPAAKANGRTSSGATTASSTPALRPGSPITSRKHAPPAATAARAGSSQTYTQTTTAPVLSGGPPPTLVYGDTWTGFYTIHNSTVGIFVLSSFEPSGDLNEDVLTSWLGGMARGLTRLENLGVKNLIVDVSGNGGGIICAGKALLRYMFPASSFVQFDIRLSDFDLWLINNGDRAARVDPSYMFQINGQAIAVGSNDSTTGLADILKAQKPSTRNGITEQFSGAFDIDCVDPFFKWMDAMPQLRKGWQPANVAVVGNGFCGSTCAETVRSMRDRLGIKAYVYGGYSATPYQPTQFEGGSVVDMNTISTGTAIVKKLADGGAAKGATPARIPVPFAGPAIGQVLWWESYSGGSSRSDVSTPEEWIPEPADGKVYVSDSTDIVAGWYGVASLMVNGTAVDVMPTQGPKYGPSAFTTAVATATAGVAAGSKGSSNAATRSEGGCSWAVGVGVLMAFAFMAI